MVFVLVKDNHSAGVQRAEDADGDEQHAVRRAHGLVQSRPPAVSGNASLSHGTVFV